jgi:predicted nucleic acid-binding protein
VSTIYWGSMVFIYLLEGHHTFLPKVERILQRIDSRGDTLATSVFTLGEVLTGPRRAGSSDLEASIKSYFASGRVAILPFDAEIADRYSIVRSTCKVTQADAIHMATASAAGVDLFVTNDKLLWNLALPGIRFIMDLDGVVH